ncbi:IPExxxVDY family protein [Olivibacter sp. XZL3]|uniref:IPExxxVDY family protein n=1 Tax=Olivibacter sp. XZL3 TaxID=1735116 RepID=UPI0010653C59|nr:IPExxxVDY family protein [Olivibacter sp. XZL3]
MNKLTLKYELDIDFNLVAITCPLKDYRLCYYINKVTGLDLHKIDDHEIWQDPQQIFYFGRYNHEDINNETSYYLLNNKGIEGGTLIPEMKVTDFFLLVKNAIDEELLVWQINQINNLKDVVVASEIDPHKLKSRENLVF